MQKMNRDGLKEKKIKIKNSHKRKENNREDRHVSNDNLSQHSKRTQSHAACAAAHRPTVRSRQARQVAPPRRSALPEAVPQHNRATAPFSGGMSGEAGTRSGSTARRSRKGLTTRRFLRDNGVNSM